MGAPKPGRPVRGSRTGRPIMVLLDLLGRRWTLRVLWELRDQRWGFRALQERCDNMSASVLATRLRELEEARIVDRDADQTYGLTRHGRELCQALAPLSRWAQGWARRGPR